MIEEPIVFLMVLVVSLLARNLTSFKNKEKLGVLYPILKRLGFIGVVVHEISHYVMNLAVGIRPESIEIHWRNKIGLRSPHGSVMSKPRSFLQAFVICLAPLYISTWLFFYSLQDHYKFIENHF